jgi:hypothetical protein
MLLGSMTVHPENITTFYVSVILSGAFPREDLII